MRQGPRDEVLQLPSSALPEAVSTPSVTDTSRSSTCISDSSFSCDSTSGSMLTASNNSLSNGGYGGLSWQVNKSPTNEDLLSLTSKDITVTYTWDPSNAVMGEVAVTAWVRSTNIMGWRWSDLTQELQAKLAMKLPALFQHGHASNVSFIVGVITLDRSEGELLRAWMKQANRA
ncbi:TPA: hypothetical protein ACH3X1_007156 [Trebouxia sp. C0004]